MLSLPIMGPGLRGHLGIAWANWINSKEGLGAMTINRVWIEEGCIKCGWAEGTCPKVFKFVDPSNTVIEGVDLTLFEDKIKQAAEECPAEVIMYE